MTARLWRRYDQQMMASSPDRWRPSDADRERYAAALAQAFSEGRIDAADMAARTSHVYTATSIGELDTLMTDLPGPPRPAPKLAPPPPLSPAQAQAQRDRDIVRLIRTGIVLVVIVAAIVVGLVNSIAVDNDGGFVDDGGPVPAEVAESP